MRFCLITTFYGAHSFGGDAVFVDRLAHALLRRGHAVDVVHCVDAFAAVRGDHPRRAHTPPEGLRVHALRSGWGALSPLLSHQTGRMVLKKRALKRLLTGGGYDVIHFHNVSLMGAPELLETKAGNAVRLMTSQEFWLVCPLSSLWKFDREICRRPHCFLCTLRAGRPPQLWRTRSAIVRALRGLDALIAPSESARQALIERGVDAPITVLPFFATDEMMLPVATPAAPGQRPYLAAVGRLVKEKGFQEVIRLMPALPAADLCIAGAGPYRPELERLAAGMPNVSFAGLLDFAAVRRLYRGARALVVPSLFLETFGYVVLEAFAAGCPVIVPARGALPTLVALSGAGLVYQDADQLLAAMRELTTDHALRENLSARALRACREHWSEEDHLERYLSLIGRRRPQPSPCQPQRRM